MAWTLEDWYQGMMDQSDAENNLATGPFNLSDFFGWTHHGETSRNISVAAYEGMYNDLQAQKQRDWLEQMWMKNNEYNTPAAQMQRAREAGLNPSLLYGQPISESTPASGGSAASSGVGNVAIPGSGAGRNFMESLMMPAQADLMRAQAEEIRSRIPVNQQKVNNMIAEYDNLKQMYAKLGIENQFATATLPSSIASALAKNQLSQEEASEARKYVEQNAKANADYLQSQIANMEALTEKARKEGKLSDAKAREIYQGIENMKQQYRILTAQAEVEEFRAQHKHSDFWMTRITNGWNAAAAGLGALEKVKEELGESGVRFSTQYNGEPGVMSMYD